MPTPRPTPSNAHRGRGGGSRAVHAPVKRAGERSMSMGERPCGPWARATTTWAAGTRSPRHMGTRTAQCNRKGRGRLHVAGDKGGRSAHLPHGRKQHLSRHGQSPVPAWGAPPWGGHGGARSNCPCGEQRRGRQCERDRLGAQRTSPPPLHGHPAEEVGGELGQRHQGRVLLQVHAPPTPVRALPPGHQTPRR